ncbi:MAG TPA: TMEM175 family protein [Fimbriimonas sp.]|nr:TMEM175 family protein [Fimbriimonas sp.]
MALQQELYDEGTELSRVRALSDGVFAIVLTFLIFRFDISRFLNAPTDAELWGLLVHHSPEMFGYALSFFIIGSFWMIHQRVFRHLVRFNGTLLWQNLTFLFFVSILPFTTSIHSGNLNSPTAWVLYSTNNAVAGLSILSIWLRCCRKELTDEEISQTIVNFFVWRIGVVPLVFILSIPIAYSNISIAVWSPAVIPVLLVLIHTRFAAKVRDLEIHHLIRRKNAA